MCVIELYHNVISIENGVDITYGKFTDKHKIIPMHNNLQTEIF